MSTIEYATMVFEKLSENTDMLADFIKNYAEKVGMSNYIEEVEPDEFDKWLIADSLVDNDETMSLDDFVRKMGFEPNDL